MVSTPHCYRCGASLAALSLPLGRLEECPECAVQLHVCRMCAQYDPRVLRQCREDDAEEVREKARANFCDYFQASSTAHDPAFTAADQQAKGRLASLFGDTDPDPQDEDGPATDADDLFK